jgi:hypothetical protein
VPYNFGLATQLLNEIYPVNVFNTSSVRNVYNPDLVTARELMVDQLAAVMRQDPFTFRRAFVRDTRMRAVLDTVARAANWGKAMPAGTAQGIGIHHEYKGFVACVAEIDATAATVNRVVPDAYTGPRVTKVTFVVDVGLPINPLGLQAQMMGGIMDGIAQALTYSLHLQDGHFLEGELGQRLLHAAVERAPRRAGDRDAADRRYSRWRRRVRGGRLDGCGGQCIRASDGDDADVVPGQSQRAARVRPAPNRATDTAIAD